MSVADPPFDESTGMRLECIALGPANLRRGRDYGLRSGGEALGDAGRARLEDFSLALSEWAKRGDPPFEILFWLGDSDQSYALLKCAYLGRGAMGTVAVAQGLLLPKEAMRTIELRAHRLLDLIPTPTVEQWAARHVTWRPRGPGVLPAEAITDLGSDLRRSPMPWPIVHIVDWKIEETRYRLLEAVEWPRASVRPGWCTTTRLPSMGKFVPTDLALRMSIVADLPEQGRGDIYVRDEQVFSGFGPTPPEVRLHDQLFRIDRTAAHDGLSQRTIDAIGQWRPAYQGLPPYRMVAYAIDDVLRQGLSSDEFWSLLVILAHRSAEIEEAPLRAEAVLGIVTLFSEATTAQPAAFAPLLMDYIERVSRLLPGQEEEPLRLAIERDVLGHLDANGIGLLLERGLARRFPRRLADVLARHRDRSPSDPDRIGLAAATALVEALNESFGEGVIDDDALALLSASVMLGASLAEANSHRSGQDRLAKALVRQGETLMGPAIRALPGWTAAAVRFAPKHFQVLLSHPAGEVARARWEAETTTMLRGHSERMRLNDDAIPDSDTVAQMLAIRSLVSPVAGEPLQ